MAFTTGTLTGTYQLPDGTPQQGRVEIIPSEPIIKDTTGKVILSGRVKVDLDANGHFSVDLPATDDATLNPNGFGYTVAAKLYTNHPPAVSGQLPGGTTVDVEEWTSVDPSTFSPTATYVESGTLATVATTGSYTDLANKPAIPSTAADVGAVPAADLDADTSALVPASSGSATSAALSVAYVGRGGATDGTGFVNVLGATERINIKPNGSAFMLDHASDLTATTPHDLFDTKHRSTGDAFYVMHLGGKAPGYNGTVGNGGVGGMAGFNCMIPWHKDDENGGGRAGSVPNDRKGQVGLTIDCQVPNTDSNPVAIHSWANQAAIYILNQDTSAARTDTGCGTTSGSATVTDTHITVSDVGRDVTGPGIPAGSYVGTVTAGASFTLSSSPTSNVPVNATATASNVSLVLDYPKGQGQALAIDEYGNGGDSVQFIRHTAHASGKTGALLRLVNEAEAGSPALSINNNAGYQFGIDHGGKLDWFNDTQLYRSNGKQLTTTGGLFIAPTGPMAGQSLNVVYPADPGNTFAAIVFNNLSTANSKILNIQQQGNSVFVIDTAGRASIAKSAAPATNASMGQLYVATDGSLHYKGTSGTDTQLAVA